MSHNHTPRLAAVACHIQDCAAARLPVDPVPTTQTVKTGTFIIYTMSLKKWTLGLFGITLPKQARYRQFLVEKIVN